MGTVIHLPYTNYEILEAEFFAKTGHLMNEADTGLEVGGEADFGKTLNAPADLVGDIFEKARRAPVKRDVGRDGRHDSTARIAPVDDDLAEIDRAWVELLGGPEVDDDSKTKKVTSSESFLVDGVPLGKSELTSRMFRVVQQIRPFCVGAEAEQLDKAVRALDITGFAELAEPVLARMKHATELIRSC